MGDSPTASIIHSMPASIPATPTASTATPMHMINNTKTTNVAVSPNSEYELGFCNDDFKLGQKKARQKATIASTICVNSVAANGYSNSTYSPQQSEKAKEKETEGIETTDTASNSGRRTRTEPGEEEEGQQSQPLQISVHEEHQHPGRQPSTSPADQPIVSSSSAIASPLTPPGTTEAEEEQLSPSQLRRSSRVSALNARKRLQLTQTGTQPTASGHQPDTGIETEGTAAEEGQGEQQAESPAERTQEPEEMVQECQESAVSGLDEETQCQDIQMVPQSQAQEGEQNQPQKVCLLKRKLKRKLENGLALDQYDCKFGIRLDTQGDVVVMTDESEISSLDGDEVITLKEHYEQNKREQLSEEVRQQRELQVRELEAELRAEEAKLAMMRKLRQSQQTQKMQQEGLRRLTAPGVVQNSAGQAYKPKVAIVNQQQQPTGTHANSTGAVPTARMNGTAQPQKKSKESAGTAAQSSAVGAGGVAAVSVGTTSIQLSTLPPQHLQVIQQLYDRLSQNPQQLTTMIKTLPPQTGQALTELLRQYAQAQTTAVVPPSGGPLLKSGGQQSAAPGVSASNLTQAQLDAANKQARELTQQNVAKARQQLRREWDQMVAKLPVPKAPASDLLFVPNGNQPDFGYLLGLDLTVQRVLKDKNLFRKSDLPPYQCEECETDFTPTWKAICGDSEDCHLYCERCVRQAQKRKIRQDCTAMLKKVFQQVQEKEKEFERQVAAGKFNVDPPVPAGPIAGGTANAMAQQTQSAGKGAQQQNQSAAQQQQGLVSSSGALKGPASVALQQLSQQQSVAAATTALNLSKQQAGPTATANALVNAAIKNAASSSSNTGQQKGAGGASGKRTGGGNAHSGNLSTASTSSTTANPLTALFQQNPLFQQQFAAVAALNNSPLLRQLSQIASNPMLATAMAANPALAHQLFALAAQQHQRAQQQGGSSAGGPVSNAGPTSVPSSGATQSQSSTAAAALAQLAQKCTTSSSSGHQRTSATGGSVPLTTTTSSSSSSQAAQQMATMAALMGGAATNPAILALQSQISQMGHNPQLLTQLNTNPQFRQALQLYMAQQMKAAGGAKK